MKPQSLKKNLTKKKIKKNANITKESRACKGYANTYNVEIWNSFNLELQLKNTQFAMKNKLIKDLLFGLRGLKLVAILVLEFKKIESEYSCCNDSCYNDSCCKLATISLFYAIY